MNVMLLSAFIGVALLCVTMAIPCYEGAFRDREEFPWCIQLSPQVAMHWQLSNEDLIVGFEAEQVGGWMGIGISEGAGGMPGADLWVVRKDAASGTFILSDTYARKFEAPEPDKQQDVDLLSVVEGNGITSAKLKRALKPCDLVEDNRLYANETHVWLWAYSPSAWPTMHEVATRGYAALVLDAPRTATSAADFESDMDEPTEPIELRMPNVPLPKETTAYWCKNFKMPSEKRHIVKIDHIANPNGIVHHMSMFGCYRTPSMRKEEYPLIPGQEKDQIYSCLITGTPPAECAAWLINWTPGQEAVEFPPEAGMAIGKGGWEWLVLEIHYNNVEGYIKEIEGKTDNSGLILHTTTNLRPADMGLLWVGSTDIAIPPGMDAYTIPPGICPSECTAKFKQPLHIPWHSPHMHQIGSAFQLPHLRLADNKRDLVEIAPLNVRRHYGFYYQGTGYVFPESNTILPGDAFVTVCTYNSLKRSNITLGGDSSMDEMCYNFINYYPRQDVEICQPYLAFSRGSKDMAFAYCATALNRADFDRAVGEVPPPANLNSMNQQQFTAWAEKNLLPVFEKYMELGVIVEYNLTKHLEAYGKKELTDLLQCTKTDTNALSLSYSVAGSKAGVAEAKPGEKNASKKSSAMGSAVRARATLRGALLLFGMAMLAAF